MLTTLQKFAATVGLEDNSGGVSSMRAMMYAIVGYILLGKLLVIYHTGTPPPWTNDELYALGVVLGAKALQRGQEKPAPPPPPVPEPTPPSP